MNREEVSMARKDLINWIGYWDRASMGPNLKAVQTAADMATCRRFNPSMTGGVMFGVSDAAMWSALVEYRRGGMSAPSPCPAHPVGHYFIYMRIPGWFCIDCGKIGRPKRVKRDAA